MCLIQYIWGSIRNQMGNNRICRSTEDILSRVYLKAAATERLTEEADDLRISYGLCSVQGWRKYQEDSHIALKDFDEDTSLFAVFDGHSGPEVAIYAAQKLPDMIRNNTYYRMGQFEEALYEVFTCFDASLVTKNVCNQLLEIRKTMLGDNIGANDKPGFNSGCTALVALVVKDEIYVANAGDSRCVLSRNGYPILLSIDHKPDDRFESRRIKKAGGRVSLGRINGGLNVSRAFGDHQYKQNKKVLEDEQMIIACPDIKVKRINYERDQFIVLACDGIWNSMTNQDVVSFVNKRIKRQSMSSICEALTLKCMSPVRPVNGIGGDNMTVILVKVKPQ